MAPTEKKKGAPETVGESECSDCGTLVYVAINSGGFAYYFCPKCKVKHQHTVHVESRKFMQNKVRMYQQGAQDDIGKKPEKAAPPETKKRELSAVEKYLQGEPV